jgi:hypothetical protein
MVSVIAIEESNEQPFTEELVGILCNVSGDNRLFKSFILFIATSDGKDSSSRVKIRSGIPVPILLFDSALFLGVYEDGIPP